MHCNVATRSGHLDYSGHLGHFLSGSKRPDILIYLTRSNCLVIMRNENCSRKLILFNRAVTDILKMQS